MALPKRVIPVDVTGGLGKGDDDFASVQLATLRDARWRLGMQIGKRNGQADRESTGLPAVGSSDRNAVVDLDGAAHVITNDGAYRSSLYSGAWTAENDGAPRPSRLVTSPLVRTNDTLTRPDCAVIGDVLCAVWEDPETSQGFYGFWDVSEDTPRLLAGPKAFQTVTATAPVVDHLRVIAVGPNANAPDRFVVVGRVGSGATADLRSTHYLLSAGTFTWSVATTLIVANATAFVTVETSRDAKNYYVAASAGGTPRYRRYDYTRALLASLALADLPIAMVHNSVLSKIVGMCSNGNLVHAADDLSGVATSVAVLAAPSSGAPFTFSRAAITLADELGNMWVARSGLGQYSLGSPSCTQMAYVSTGFAVTGAAVVGQYVLAGGAFYTPLVGPVFCIADQFTNVTTTPAAGTIALKAAPVGYYARPKMRSVGTGDNPSFAVSLILCGRFNQDAYYGYDTDWHLPRVCDDLTRRAQTEPQRWFMCSSVGASDSASFAGRKVDLVSPCFFYADPARNVTAQGLRLLGNGCGNVMCDGMMFAENTPPCPGYLASDGVDTGITQAGNLYGTASLTGAKFIVVWRWQDAKGNIHRSAPSSPFEVAIGGGLGGLCSAAAPYNPLKIVFPKYLPTGLMGDQFTTPEVEVYMYPVGVADAEYRLIGIVPPADDPDEEGRSYFVTMNTSISVPIASAIRYRIDATEGNWSTLGVGGDVRPGLYTDSDELESWPTPPLLDIVSTESRLWGLSAEGARLNVWYTKPIEDGRAPEWSPLLTISIPQEGGDCVALAALDDKVVALKRRQIFVISGDPGDSAGNGSSLQRPRLVSGDVGCINVNSVVEGPFGVAFQSERGWYTLSRDLQLSFIGEPMISAFDADWAVEDTPRPYVECSILVPSESEVRWAVADTKGNAALAAVWNYRLNKWNVYTVFDARSFALVGGVPWKLGYSTFRSETFDAWSQHPSPTQQITFPWLKLNGLAGFQRLWRIVLTFRWFSGGIAVRTSTNYAAATETVKAWSEATLLTLYDATTGLVQLDIRPTVQRCEALRVQIVGTSDEGRGFELVGCQLEIGAKAGAFKKLSAAAKG